MIRDGGTWDIRRWTKNTDLGHGFLRSSRVLLVPLFHVCFAEELVCGRFPFGLVNFIWNSKRSQPGRHDDEQVTAARGVTGKDGGWDGRMYVAKRFSPGIVENYKETHLLWA